MALEAIIFDLDGTIIDTETPDFRAWAAVYEKHNVPLTANLWEKRTGSVAFAGFDPAAYLEETAGVKLDAAARQMVYQNYLERCEQEPILPGIMDVLNGAASRNIKLAVASNSDRVWVDKWLNFHNLYHYFQCVFTCDDVQNPKPAPDLYLQAAQCLSVKVDHCIAVEDSPTGMRAAVAAGMRCIAIPNWVTKNHPRPDGITVTLSSLAEMPLEKLLERF